MMVGDFESVIPDVDQRHVPVVDTLFLDQVTRKIRGGGDRIRTGDKGFADLCLTTWPRRQIKKLIVLKIVHCLISIFNLQPAIF